MTHFSQISLDEYQNQEDKSWVDWLKKGLLWKENGK